MRLVHLTSVVSAATVISSVFATPLASRVSTPTCSENGTIAFNATRIEPEIESALPTILATTVPGQKIAPKVIIWANTFEFGFVDYWNFTTLIRGNMLESVLACTPDLEVCKFECGQELVGAAQITAVLLIPGLDLSKTYFIISGTGGVNPKYATAGGVAISKFVIQWEWGGMFLGSDLPANFSGQYFASYAQLSPDEYPSTVGTEVYKFNDALIDRFYDIGSTHPYEDVSNASQALRKTYQYDAAKRPPSLVKCDTVSSQIYWHGDVAGENVEYYSNVITTGQARPCHTNQDDTGRIAGLFLGAVHQKLDFTRVAMIKAFSNFDRPPPQLTAYQSRFFVGEAATEAGLRNAWVSIIAVVKDVVGKWDEVYECGVKPNSYVGDLKERLGGKSDFGTTAGAAPGSVQGAPP